MPFLALMPRKRFLNAYKMFMAINERPTGGLY
jgi:hypothetical protein